MSKEKIEGKHEYISLEVNEISLVDKGANLQEFAVIKCITVQEDTNMAESKEKVTKAEESAKATDSVADSNTDVEKVSVDVAKAEGEAAKKAMQQLTDLVSGITKTIEAAKDDKSDNKDEEIKKNKTPRELFEETLKNSKLKDEAVKKAMEKYDEAFPKKDKEEKKVVEAEKSDSKDKDDSERILNILSEAIEKGRKLTPKREETLKGAIESLANLLKEMQTKQETVASTVADSSENVVAKSLGDLSTTLKGMVDKFGELSKVTKELGERVETIEKTKQPSKSEQDDDAEIKKNDNMWSDLGL